MLRDIVGSEGKLLDEKVVPTTVLIAGLAWGITGKRRELGNRQHCCRCFSTLVDACSATGRLRLKFYCMTDVPPPGHVQEVESGTAEASAPLAPPV